MELLRAQGLWGAGGGEDRKEAGDPQRREKQPPQCSLRVPEKGEFHLCIGADLVTPDVGHCCSVTGKTVAPRGETRSLSKIRKGHWLYLRENKEPPAWPFPLDPPVAAIKPHPESTLQSLLDTGGKKPTSWKINGGESYP